MIRLLALWVVLLPGLPGCELDDDDERKEKLAPTGAKMSVVDGAVVVSLEPETLERGGIRTEPLRSTSYQPVIRALGTVLPIQEWVDLHNAHEAAKAQAEVAQAAFLASRQEYLRLKGLYEEGANASQRAVQIAEAAYRADEARVRATRVALQSVARNARQQWGESVGRAILAGSDPFGRVASLEQALVQVSLPAGENLPGPPRTVQIRTSQDNAVAASFIARLPRTDPRFQGTTLLYGAARGGFEAMAGANVPVLLASGKESSGVFIPAAALVHWQGKVWAYVQTAELEFARREVSTELTAEGGCVAARGFAEGERVVIQGAQLLLSQELLGQIDPGGEDD